MVTPIIRKAELRDCEGIHNSHMRSIREICVHQHGVDEIRGWGNRPLSDKWQLALNEGEVWVVEFENKICGHGYLRFLKDSNPLEARIAGLYLTPEVIGMGLGKKLISLMLKFAYDRGAVSVSLRSTLTAHDFYSKFGFVDSSPLYYKEYGGSMVRGYDMQLNLRSCVICCEVKDQIGHTRQNRIETE